VHLGRGTGDLGRVEDRHAAQLLDPLRQHVEMLQLLVRMLDEFLADTRRHQADRHVGVLFVLEV